MELVIVGRQNWFMLSHHIRLFSIIILQSILTIFYDGKGWINLEAPVNNEVLYLM